MKKNFFNWMAILMVAFVLGITSISCEKEKIETEKEYTEDDSYNNNTSGDNGESIDIQKLVNENVTADVKYEYFTFSLELYTYLTDPGKYFAGRSDIKYGVEWSYTNRTGMIYSHILDPENRFMDTTIISSNHYSVVVPIFVWDDDSEKTVLMNMYSFQYRACKQAEERGEKLTSDERSLMISCGIVL